MKRVIALLLVVVLCVGLCACSNSGTTKNSKEDKVVSEVKSYITFEIKYYYDTVGMPTITTHVEKISENTYEVTGKVTIKDKYGDSYTGKYDAEVEYNPSTEKCSVDLNLGKLYKD